MSRDFSFKQFVIKQQNAPFKVGTDGVLLGAWADVFDNKLILDIGTGTGLIALMLAQRNPQAKVLALEKNQEALKDAELNFRNASFSNQLTLIAGDLKEFNPSQKLDHIVSNPPYFENSLKNSNPNLSSARHQNDGFTLIELFHFAEKHLAENGKLSLVIPNSNYPFLFLSKFPSFKLNRICEVKGRANMPAKRLLLSFTKTDLPLKNIDETLIIETDRHIYTPQYSLLTEHFYL